MHESNQMWAYMSAVVASYHTLEGVRSQAAKSEEAKRFEKNAAAKLQAAMGRSNHFCGFTDMEVCTSLLTISNRRMLLVVRLSRLGRLQGVR